MQNTPSKPRRARRAALLGVFLGIVLGAGFALASGPAGADRQALGPTGGILDATHLPPLLTVAGESVELRYHIYCAAVGETEESSCAPGGTVYARPGTSGPFRALPLVLDERAADGRYVVRVPKDIATSRNGFTYYAVLRGEPGTAAATLPAGGPDAPHRSLPLERPVLVSLGRHAFGSVRSADARIAYARWGNGPGEVGLEGGRNVPPAGGSSFDVDQTGTIFVLDQVGRRVLRWSKGAGQPTAIPVAVDGTVADLSVAVDGTMHVLEGARARRPPALRSFDRSGARTRVVELAERSASQVRVGPNGPIVLQQPSGQWLPAYSGGSPLAAPDQKTEGRVGRPLPGGSEVVVLRTGREIRAALLRGGLVTGSWRVVSETPVAEVQLVEPVGNALLMVARVYTDTQDEFQMLLLGPRGLVGRASLDSADWAETAPLSRFRLSGSSLYQLGSTPAGLFVDRFDLEVN